ncbi:MAG TPA: ATP-binding protein, partial [bacterium]|nr:ATP-binding protein [bacterium]
PPRSTLDGTLFLDLALHDCTGRGIEISRRLAAGLPMITARPGELDQIFLNLVNNAVDAMPSGGALTVETEEMDGVVEVRVADTGEGIAPENLERIFEPFYTTRRSRRGVGLGLPVVREIIERYGGTISVESEVGKGTTFTVRIPASGLKDEETPSEK